MKQYSYLINLDQKQAQQLDYLTEERNTTKSRLLRKAIKDEFRKELTQSSTSLPR
jgi:predicted transcriptional regulator|tara:strand:+ start:1216 stop:1380 length:165 start_codon:yes stop_codon:yes gene_type:complete